MTGRSAMTGRERLAEQQAELLRALLAGGEPPAGFDRDRLDVETTVLRDKRRRVTAYLRPDLFDALGARFAGLFTEYAVAQPKSVDLRAREDADAFARWLADRGELREPKWWRRFLPGRRISSGKV
jgi:hypothetical protein